MKKHNVPEKVAEVLKEIGMNRQDAGWDCHGTYVLLHKALEKVAAIKNVVFEPPEVLSANVTAKEAVVLCVGHMGDKTEWSIGEAAPYNNKNSYPFAMAEKRAKDRVILKLVGLHGDVYSEDEADAFQQSAPSDMKGTTQMGQGEPSETDESPSASNVLSLRHKGQVIAGYPTVRAFHEGCKEHLMKKENDIDKKRGAVIYKESKEDVDTAINKCAEHGRDDMMDFFKAIKEYYEGEDQ